VFALCIIIEEVKAMARSLFATNELRICNSCLHGRSSNYGDKILCRQMGITDPHFSCKKFKYNPLKRIPFRAPVLPDFDIDEFKI
jgi:hypothetical protein